MSGMIRASDRDVSCCARGRALSAIQVRIAFAVFAPFCGYPQAVREEAVLAVQTALARPIRPYSHVRMGSETRAASPWTTVAWNFHIPWAGRLIRQSEVLPTATPV